MCFIRRQRQHLSIKCVLSLGHSIFSGTSGLLACGRGKNSQYIVTNGQNFYTNFDVFKIFPLSGQSSLNFAQRFWMRYFSLNIEEASPLWVIKVKHIRFSFRRKF